jgi:glyoxylate reductase
MAKKKPVVVVTRKLPDVVETRMRELFETRLNESDRPFSQAELVEAVRTADVLVPTVTDRIDSSVLSQAGENLKLIANFGNGVDNIDVVTANNRGINVTNTPGVLTEDTADMTMALMLAVPRRLSAGIHASWKAVTGPVGRQPGCSATGSGANASASSAWAGSVRPWPAAPRPSACQIHYHNRRRVPAAVEEELEATYWESLDQMLARMDVVSINCPHTPGTFHLLSARRLELLKKDAYIVNTARGEVIDENALIRMLEAGELAGAGLDVFEHEPAVNPKLVKLDERPAACRIWARPRSKAASKWARRSSSTSRHSDGHRPPDRVLPSML